MEGVSMKRLYREKLGKVTVTLYQRNDDKYILLLEDNYNYPLKTIVIYDNFDDAFAYFSGTCDQACTKYGITRPLPDMPNFANAINI